MITITVTDIAAAYADRMGITKIEAKERVESVFYLTKKGLIDCVAGDADKVFINGFGTFTTQMKPAHTMTSNLNGEAVDVPEKIVVKFKAATALKEKVNS